MNEVVVSTDDDEIAAVSEIYGANVVRRPAVISGDTASSESALQHAADVVEKRNGRAPAILVLVQCTSPFMSAQDIDGTIAPVLDGIADSVFAVIPFHHFVWRRDLSENAVGVNHSGKLRVRRQDVEPQFLEAGSVYAMRLDQFRREGDRFCGRTLLHEVSSEHCLEIDTLDDLRRAQRLFPVIAESEIRLQLPDPVHAFVLDFDGVITDDTVSIGPGGNESVRCSRQDGLGIELLREVGVPMLVISKERDPIVSARCEKLKIPVLQGIDDKLPALKCWVEDRKLSPENIIYMGNDINDRQCLNYAGCAVGPSNSHPSIVDVLDIVLEKPGGRGAVREMCDLILRNYNGSNRD